MRGFGMDFATPQTLAKIQDEQAERERARRVKEANLAAYDAARMEERSRSGGSVSATENGPDGRTTSFSNTTIGPDGSVHREGWGALWDDALAQNDVYKQYADLGRRAAEVKRHNAQLMSSAANSVMKIAKENGGRIPRNVIDQMNRDFGFDGKSRAIYGGGYTQDGNFVIEVAEQGRNGSIVRNAMTITPEQRYNMMFSAPGVWGQNDVDELYASLRNNYRKGTLRDPAQFGVMLDKMRGVNEERQRQQENAAKLKFITSIGTQLIKDAQKSGKPADMDYLRGKFIWELLKNGNTSKAIMMGHRRFNEDTEKYEVVPLDINDPDDLKLIQSRVKKMVDMDPRFAKQQQGEDGQAQDADGPSVDPIEQRMKLAERVFRMAFPEQAVRTEARSERNVTDGRQQQLIHYIDSSGRLHTTNGYDVDGKLYDSYGQELGGTPISDAEVRARIAAAEKLGREVEDEPASPIGVADGGEVAGEVEAAGGGVNWTPGHDLRNDGKTYKGTGWLGVLRLPNGGVASEYTVGVEIGGKEIDIPTLVPTLTKEEQDLMVNDIIPNNKDVPDSIMKKAVDFAKMRLANGRSVFANDGTPQSDSEVVDESGEKNGLGEETKPDEVSHQVREARARWGVK